jgi:hypothetical protein
MQHRVDRVLRQRLITQVRHVITQVTLAIGLIRCTGQRVAVLLGLALSADRQVSDMAMGGRGAFRDRRSDRWPASGTREVGRDPTVGRRNAAADPLTY